LPAIGARKRAERTSAQTGFGTRAATRRGFTVFEQARLPNEAHEKKGHQHLVPNASRCKGLLPEPSREPHLAGEAKRHVLHRVNKTRQ
jgi:hypothetical protein